VVIFYLETIARKFSENEDIDSFCALGSMLASTGDVEMELVSSAMGELIDLFRFPALVSTLLFTNVSEPVSEFIGTTVDAETEEAKVLSCKLPNSFSSKCWPMGAIERDDGSNELWS